MNLKKKLAIKFAKNAYDQDTKSLDPDVDEADLFASLFRSYYRSKPNIEIDNDIRNDATKVYVLNDHLLDEYRTEIWFYQWINSETKKELEIELEKILTELDDKIDIINNLFNKKYWSENKI